MAGFPAPFFPAAPGQTGRKPPSEYAGPSAQSSKDDFPYDPNTFASNASAFEHNTNTLNPGFDFGANLGFPAQTPGFDYSAGFPAPNPAAIPFAMPPIPPMFRNSWDPQNSAPFWPVPTGAPDSMWPPAGVGSNALPFPPLSALPPINGAPSTLPAVQEEGELSEGEYQEEPSRQTKPPSNRPDVRSETRRHYQNYEPSFDAAARRRPPSPEQKISPPPQTDQYGRSLRQQSDSYSPPSSIRPVASPKVRSNNAGTNKPFNNRRGPSSVPAQTGERNSSAIRFNENSLAYDGNLKTASETALNQTKRLQEARKHAQNAVLNLLPLKVQFQSFLDEGIDESVIRGIFNDIGMPMPAKLPNQSESASQPLIPSRRASEINENAPQANGIKPSDDSAFLDFKKGEQRKDRIARLLEERKKVAKPEPSTTQLPEVVQQVKSVPVAPSSSKTDKDRILRQKMEALQKSREARAAVQPTGQATPPAPVGQSSSPLSESAQRQPEQPHQPTDFTTDNQPSGTKPPASTQEISQPAAMPSIPGLFLAGQAGVPRTTSESPNVSGNTRKRPVASDFDSSTPPATCKRPFGHNRTEQRMVIDVSDGRSDSDDSDMELDDPIPDRSEHHGQRVNQSKPRKNLHGLPPLTDIPPRKGFTTPTSAISTPSAMPNKSGSPAQPETLKRKELEIETMRRKIAEAELRKKAKLAASESQSPMRKISTPIEEKTAEDSNTPDKVDMSIQIEQLVTDASERLRREQEKLVKAQELEGKGAEDLNTTESDQKRERQAKIAADRAALDAEVRESEMRLKNLRAETERVELTVKERMEDKRRLAEEMERLGQEFDDQLQAQKDQLKELNADIATTNDASSTNYARMDTEPTVIDTASKAVTSQQDVAMAEPEQSSKSPMRASTPPSALPEGLAAAAHNSPLKEDMAMAELEVLPQSSTDHPVQAAEPSESMAAVEWSNPKEDVQSPSQGRQDEQLANHPEPPVSDERDAQLPSRQRQDEELANQPEEPVSDEQERVHAAEQAHPEVSGQTSVDPKDDESSTSGSSMVESESTSSSSSAEMDLDETHAEGNESDEYEPPEATHPSTSGPVATDNLPLRSSSPVAGREVSELPPTSTSKELHPVSEPHVQDPATLTSLQSDADRGPAGASFFTPYETPLKNFRAYRLHPEYSNNVRDGFRSITYSNRILPNEMFCPTELMGKACEESTCDFQHFRDVKIPDEAILMELGGSAQFKDDDQSNYTKGMRKLLKSLRKRDIFDFQTISSKISEYQRNFVGDSVQILPLNTPSNDPGK